MHMSSLIVLFLACLIAFVIGLRGTIYEAAVTRRNFGGFLIGIELFLFVILGVFVIEIFDLSSFILVHVTEPSVRQTSPIILWSVFLLLVSLSAFSRILFPRYLMAGPAPIHRQRSPGAGGVALDATLLILVLVTIAVQVVGVRHAFIESVFFGESLLSVRLANRYQSGVPTLVMSYCFFLWALASILYGLHYRRMSSVGRLMRLLFLSYTVTLWGGKAPILISLILILLGSMSQAQKISVRSVVMLAIALAMLPVLLFFIVAIQYPEMDVMGFSQFIIHRLAVGQIQGVYEQFALHLSNSGYIWHSIPFANYFVQHDVFNKDLMMHTLGIGRDPGDFGVMNSLFIGEALAIGGYPLVVLSPVFVAFNYCVLSVSLILMLNILPGLDLAHCKRIVQLLVPSIALFTGDIAGLLFFKLNVMAIGFLAPVIGLSLFWHYLVKSFRREAPYSGRAPG
jgi:hypothetical protein